MSQEAYDKLQALMYGSLCDSVTPSLLRVRELYEFAVRMEQRALTAENKLRQLEATRAEVRQHLQKTATSRPAEDIRLHLGDGAYVDITGRFNGEIRIYSGDSRPSLASNIVYLEYDAVRVLFQAIWQHHPALMQYCLPQPISALLD